MNDAMYKFLYVLRFETVRLMKSTIIIVAFIIPFAFALYVLLTPPNEIVVNMRGEPVGLINEIKASVQGNQFWLNQEKLILEKIKKTNLSQIPIRDKEQLANILNSRLWRGKDSRLAYLLAIVRTKQVAQ